MLTSFFVLKKSPDNHKPLQNYAMNELKLCGSENYVLFSDLHVKIDKIKNGSCPEN